MPHLREHGFETGNDDDPVVASAVVHCAPTEPERCCPSPDERAGAASSSRTACPPRARDDD